MPDSYFQVSDHGTNKVLTPHAMSQYTLWRLKNQLLFPRLARRNFEPIFAEDIIGDHVSVKRPYYAFIGKGRVITDADFNKLVDQSVDIKIDQRPRGAMMFNDEERTMDIMDFGDRYLQSMVEEIAEQYDIDGGRELGNGFFMNEISSSSLDFDGTSKIARQAIEMSIPISSNNYAILNPSDVESLGEALQGSNAANSRPGFDIPSGTVEQSRIREAYQGKLKRYHVFESVHIPYYETVSLHASAAPKVNAPSGYVGSELPTDGWGNNAQQILKKGNIIQLAGVNQVMVRTGTDEKRETGRVASFVVTEDVSCSASGAATIPIYPAINDGTLSVNGVVYKAGKNVSAKPANNAVVTVLGAAKGSAKRRKQSVFYNRDALEYIQIRLVAPQSALRSGVSHDPESGVTIMFLEDFVLKTVETQLRADAFYGVKNIYPEIGIRYIGEEF